MPLTAPLRRLLGRPKLRGGVPIELWLPPQEPYSREVLDIRPRPVKQWLGDLPWAHIGRTTERVFEHLARSNRLALDPLQRLRFLEQIRSAIRYVEQSLRKHYIGMTFSLPQTNQEVVSLAEALCEQAAVGYKAVVRDLAAGTPRRDARSLALAIHRSMRCLTRLLLVNCHTYMPCAEGVWAEMHRLYEYAELQGIHGQAVDDDSYQLVKQGTVSNVLKQVALLALTDPYHLPQRDIDQIFAALELWAPLVELRRASKRDGPESFVVHLQGDEPPSRISLEGLAGDDTWRILDTSRLVHMLRGHQDSADGAVNLVAANGLQPLPLSSNSVVTYLIQSWDARPGRQADRADRPLSVEVINGLNAIHRYLKAEAEKYLRETSGDADEQPEEWVPLGSPRTAPVIKVDLAASSVAFEPLDAVTHHCVAIDHSLGGCRLQWRPDDTGNVKVGALVLVSSGDPHQRQGHMLGVVRWLKQEKSEPLEAGVQWLSPSPAPVLVRPARTDAEAPGSVGGLVLPRQRLDRHMRVLVPSVLTYRAGDEIRVEGREGVQRYTLTAVGEQTPAFSTLQLAAVIEPEEVEAVSALQRPAAVAERFTGLWERL